MTAQWMELRATPFLRLVLHSRHRKAGQVISNGKVALDVGVAVDETVQLDHASVSQGIVAGAVAPTGDSILSVALVTESLHLDPVSVEELQRRQHWDHVDYRLRVEAELHQPGVASRAASAIPLCQHAVRENVRPRRQTLPHAQQCFRLELSPGNS
jgi:hypothetical protein